MDKPVLIIEEDELNRKLIADLLHMRGIHSVQSTSQCDLEALAETQAFRLILLNTCLPARSEVKMSRFLKSHPILKHIPIVLLTAYSDHSFQRLFSEFGCVDIISKPLAINDFYNTVQKFLAPDPVAVAG